MNDEPRPVPPEKRPETGSAPPDQISHAKLHSTVKTILIQRRVSPTAQDTHEQDVLGLGRTAGQRAAEIFAGLRAELTRSPESAALTRIPGRVAARMIISIGSKKALNFVPVRHGAFTGLIKQALGQDSSGKVLVELAAGFSPRGILLAKEMPDLQVIEIDLPDVIQEKQKRLQRAQISIPPNITWKSADLGVEPLGQLLVHRRADVVSAEGLLPCFDDTGVTRIARQVKHSLNPGGTFIADLGFSSPQGEREAGGLVKLFQRYTHVTPGSVSDEETAYRLFREAEYEAIELYRMPQAAEMFSLAQPVSDVLFFMVARTALEDS